MARHNDNENDGFVLCSVLRMGEQKFPCAKCTNLRQFVSWWMNERTSVRFYFLHFNFRRLIVVFLSLVNDVSNIIRCENTI